MSEHPVNQRAQQILKILVERYIQEGTPVASRSLAEQAMLNLSPATIRNILADLEDAGYLTSPHTSAGRIPTAQGYRFFVNSLLTVRPLEEAQVEALEHGLNPDMAMPNLVQSASSLLSDLTHMIGVVTLPRRNREQLRQVEFVTLSSNRVLVILVMNGREVQNRVIHTNKTYTQSELQQIANYLNSQYTGQDLTAIRQNLLVAMEQDKDHMNRLMQATIEVANKAFSTGETQPGYVMAGQNNMFNYIDQGGLDQARSLFEAFTRKQEVLQLLDNAMAAEGVQIFIGKESGHNAFDECSIVTSSYSVNGQLVGSLGVIGPTRMPYERVITAVDVTAKLLSAALNQA